MLMIANTPAPPYYAVIFSSERTEVEDGYESMAERMVELVQNEPGFLGYESARNEMGITISYWANLEAIHAWKQNTEHLAAQQKGKQAWYAAYKVRICKVERDYSF